MNANVKFRTITKLAYEKCYTKQMLKDYPYLKVGKQLCHSHYCKLVEPNEHRFKKKVQKESILETIPIDLISNDVLEPINPKPNNLINNSFASSIDILTKALYYQQRHEGTGLELDPVNFERMIETISPDLKWFFNCMTDAIIPKEHSAYNRNEAKKSVVGLCYLMAGLYNKFVNQYKLEVGLYLRASGAMWEAIDTMSSLEYSACTKTNNFHIYNIDDYHSIHENRRPNMVSTLTANHFATCVAKLILGCSSVPLVFNGVSVYNLENVEALRIYYMELQGRLVSNYFDMIELLTIHSYADNIEERKEERSIKDVQLLGFKKQDLHSVQDYTNVLNLILSINNKTHHLDRQVAPIITNWPSQIFIRKALYMRTLPKFQSLFSQQIETFLPILGPLHVLLNCREQVIMNKPFIGTHAEWLDKNKDKIIKKFGRKDVDLLQLPTGYSTAHPPRPELCDSCKSSLVDNNGICQKFLTRIKKEKNTLTKKDFDEGDNNNIESQEEKSEELEEIDISPRLIAEINQIEH
ncbi:hypothetical protein C2G38_2159171 [Gigaspora rosea]|uniref:Uncharacterized protein n=1 Tax=Gigaspora rosea TaxID=44941 RepID=A0A397W1Q6_9GLOM|nr:hypothetical protein C2G38_2159171 [Gigaspora rosea]